MAAIRSLGVHTPSALPYLIAESVLPENPSENQYKWETYHDDTLEPPIEEEVVTTDYCVVYSRNGVVCKVFRFEIEIETVHQAVLTWFPSHEGLKAESQAGVLERDKTSNAPLGSSNFADEKWRGPSIPVKQGPMYRSTQDSVSRVQTGTSHGRSRALVVFLKSQAHIHFLFGSTHIMNLPFEVENAFPAPRGLIIQRRIKKIQNTGQPPATPRVPAAPPNSFLSPLLFEALMQNRSTAGLGFSPSTNVFRNARSSFLKPKHMKAHQPSPAPAMSLGSLGQPRTLFGDNRASDGLPRTYALTDPLSEMGLVVDTATSDLGASRLSTRSLTDSFQPLSIAEEIIYVSAADELPAKHEPGDRELMLIVTANRTTGAYSLWYASYVETTRASSVTLHSAPSFSGAHSRRRSSFIPGTGASTPAVRNREVPRDSFGGLSRSKTVPASSTAGATHAKEAAGSQTAEETLASRLDPDLDLSRQPARESRRVSSLLSRGGASTSFDQSAFEDLATKHTSFRGSLGGHARRSQSHINHAERTSLGGALQSTIRASSPGSVSRYSTGDASFEEVVDDFVDNAKYRFLEPHGLVSERAANGDPHVSDLLALQESTIGLRKELLVTRYATIPMEQDVGGPGTAELQKVNFKPKVFTIASPRSLAKTGYYHDRFCIYIVPNTKEGHIQIECMVNRIALPIADQRHVAPKDLSKVRHASIPALATMQRFDKRIDAIKIRDGDECRLVYIGRDLTGTNVVYLDTHQTRGSSSALALSLEYLYSTTSYTVSADQGTSGPSKAPEKMFKMPESIRGLQYSGPAGTLDLVDQEGRRHRIQITFRPRNPKAAKVLDICRCILPMGDILLVPWWRISTSCLGSDNRNVTEWSAVVATLFCFALASTDAGYQESVSKKSPQKAGVSPSLKIPNSVNDMWEVMWQLEKSWQGSSWNSSAWDWAVGPSHSGVQCGFIRDCTTQARDFLRTLEGKDFAFAITKIPHFVDHGLSCLLIALHLIREEEKLDTLSHSNNTVSTGDLRPVLAQLGWWLGWDFWDWRRGSFYDLDASGAEEWIFDETHLRGSHPVKPPWEQPPSIFEWMEKAIRPDTYHSFPSIDALLDYPASAAHTLLPGQAGHLSRNLTPRTYAISTYLARIHAGQGQDSAAKRVEVMAECGIDSLMLETFPEAVAAIFRKAIAECRANPPTTWDRRLLSLVGREDLDVQVQPKEEADSSKSAHPVSSNLATMTRDVHSICHSAETPDPISSSPVVDRNMITRLIFSEDRRFVEALRLTEPLRVAVAECPPDPSWSEAELLEAQKGVVQWVMVRTFALAPSQAMVWFDSRKPLLTEKFVIHGYSTVCLMKPMNMTVTADRGGYTEEKYAWAWFHAGASAGLSISRHAEGIDTSWIVFNKPADLNNRHAGLLLGLGLNGHLRSIAKWLSFKYLTPKHTMTSIGLLLGLSAAYLGTMDTLVTRLLSVHITRMLPPGAAELNLSPLTQTTGLMGIGLLYYNTQHRRMSEIMLSEIEHVELEDATGAPDSLRDEGYRLAAGFALGFINLGKGKDLKGLHDMRIVERLLAVAVGPRPVDIVHILDQATAGATIAIALIFMKTQNEAVARKIDVPDTLPQFDYVRPDIFLLRTLAKHLIMWDGIEANRKWMVRNLPSEYASDHLLKRIKVLRSEHMHFYNIVAGLLWSVGLRFAGSGDVKVRDFLVEYLDQFIRLCQLPAIRYDSRLARNTIRNCQDLVALSAATVMAGTGDLQVFRRLRLLHGRVNPETPYGSHLAAHQAIGVLFIGGGSYTFGTSNLATAALICAFYPLFPMDVLDNKAHLQAFRHLWALAAEPRCIVVRDIDSNRAISLPIQLTLKDGTEKPAAAPCLLPDLDAIAAVRTASPEHWPVTLDFERNPAHLAAFRRTQTVHVRRRPAAEAHRSVFGSTLAALDDAQPSHRAARGAWDWIFALPAFAEFATSDLSLILPADANSSVHTDPRGTVVDERLSLARCVGSGERDRLWNLRLLFAWAESAMREGDGRLAWLGKEVVEGLRAGVMERARRVEEEL